MDGEDAVLLAAFCKYHPLAVIRFARRLWKWIDPEYTLEDYAALVYILEQSKVRLSSSDEVLVGLVVEAAEKVKLGKRYKHYKVGVEL